MPVKFFSLQASIIHYIAYNVKRFRKIKYAFFGLVRGVESYVENYLQQLYFS